MTDKILKLIPLTAENSIDVEETIIPSEKRRNTKRINVSIVKIEHHKKSILLNHSTFSQFVIRKWIEVNDLSGGQDYINKNIRLQTTILGSNLCDYYQCIYCCKIDNRYFSCCCKWIWWSRKICCF